MGEMSPRGRFCRPGRPPSTAAEQVPPSRPQSAMALIDPELTLQADNQGIARGSLALPCCSPHWGAALLTRPYMMGLGRFIRLEFISEPHLTQGK
jgi:hypothetical protein